MNLPEELMITEEDLEGDYASNTDCWLARALKRIGMSNFSILNFGSVFNQSDEAMLGSYVWENGETFCSSTKRTGRVVLDRTRDIDKYDRMLDALLED